MRLSHFTLTNYRSITKAEKLSLGSLSVLVGPNNEGKSNILRALVLGMRVLERAASGSPLRGRSRTLAFRRVLDEGDYSWERDFPMQLQESRPDGKTTLRYDFVLNDEELETFRQRLGSRINNNLPVRIQLSTETVQINVLKQGPGKQALGEKSKQVAALIGELIDVAYVPAVRQFERSEDVVRSMLDRQLRELEYTEEYRAAVKSIEDLQRPVLDRLGGAIGDTLKDFLPQVESVSLNYDSSERYRALRQSLRISVNDGNETDLSTKGDGVQSLAAVALMRHLMSSAGGSREVVLAIEEPESHLHPGAVHRLRKVLREIAAEQQVVVSTHSPIFASRARVSDNIIVSRNRASPARNMEQVRKALGVRVDDNLRSARRVLVVEGESDLLTIPAIVTNLRPEIGSRLEDGELSVLSLGGGGNLGYQLAQLRTAVCDAYVVVDNDQAGLNALENALAEGLIDLKDTFALTLLGRRESELEDCFDPQIYTEVLKRDFAITLGSKANKSREKWSSRVERAASESGKIWTRELQRRVKVAVAREVSLNPQRALHEGALGLFQNLADSLEAWSRSQP